MILQIQVPQEQSAGDLAQMALTQHRSRDLRVGLPLVRVVVQLLLLLEMFLLVRNRQEILEAHRVLGEQLAALTFQTNNFYRSN
jgi:hypothetical protein